MGPRMRRILLSNLAIELSRRLIFAGQVGTPQRAGCRAPTGRSVWSPYSSATVRGNTARQGTDKLTIFVPKSGYFSAAYSSKQYRSGAAVEEWGDTQRIG